MKRLSIIFILCLFISQCAQSQTPKTLLWKISGNGLSKPSYLYGTMHSNDKRVYFMGDSVYSSLASCESFAMEVDPGDLLDTLIQGREIEQIDVGYRIAIENNLVSKEPGYYYKRYREMDSMYRELMKRYQDLSPRDIARLRKVFRRREKNDTKTVLDLFLFDIAKKQGKVMMGIEDIGGREALRDEMGNTFDPDEYLKSDRKKYVDIEEWMVANYTAAELDKIDEFSIRSRSKKSSHIFNNRNELMAARIDSAGRIRSLFCAVGAAHLPGDSGVISLLRQRGYSVDPVFSTRIINPRDVQVEYRSHLFAVSDADSNYIVQLPGKSTDITFITNKYYVRTYKELFNEILLMHGVYEDGKMYKTVEEVKDEIRSFFTWNDIKLSSAKKINRQEIDGYELQFKNREGYIKLHIFHNKGKTYMFAAGSADQDSLNSTRSNDYLDSYVMITDKAAAESKLNAYKYPDKAFVVYLPFPPKRENVKGDSTSTKEDITLFSSIDLSRKVSYLVLVKEPFKGYFTRLDSSVFTQTFTEIARDVVQTSYTQEEIILDGYPAIKLKMTGEKEGKRYLIYAVLGWRDNRFYNLTARGLAVKENEQLFDKFIGSFHFLPYHETTFESHTGGNNLFSVITPSPIYTVKSSPQKLQNGAGLRQTRTDYHAFDVNKAMTYSIASTGFSKYYWAESGEALIKEYADLYYDDPRSKDRILSEDSLINQRNVSSGKLPAVEMLLKDRYSNSYSRVRIIHYRDSVFALNIMGAKSLVTDEKADAFFNSFRFTDESFVTTAFTSKTELLINDLQSADSFKYIPAILALKGGYKFPANDLPKILEAFIYNYGAIKNVKYDIPGLLASVIKSNNGEQVLNFIVTNYPLLRNKREDLRTLMINILSSSQSKAAYEVLKTNLISDPPANSDFIEMLTNLGRSTGLAAGLFPEISVKLKDRYMSQVIFALANMLVDSGKIHTNSLESYEDELILESKKILHEYQERNSAGFYVPHTNAFIGLLAKMNQKKSRGILNDLLDVNNTDLHAAIIIELAKNDQAVSSEIIDRYSKDPGRQLSLYDELVKIRKPHFFTGRYASQSAFAQTFAGIYTDNEIRSSTVAKQYDVAAIKDVAINNRMHRFFVFKVRLQYRLETEIYTCIIGPFSTNNSDFSIKAGEEMYILYRTKYDAGKIDTLFNDFIDKAKKLIK